MEKGFEIKCLDEGFVRLIDWYGSDLRIVEAARISHHSASKGEEADKKLLRYLWVNRHTSPFEQVCVTFNIKMPIFVMRQYVRHRMHSLNEVSARYTELPDVFYLPERFRAQDTKNKQGSVETAAIDHGACQEQVQYAYRVAYEVYKSLLQKGVAKEQARIVLPVGIYTEIYARWDLRNLLHFFELRDDSHAQYEIRVFSNAMKAIAAQLFPWTLETYEEERKPKPVMLQQVPQPKREGDLS